MKLLSKYGVIRPKVSRLHVRDTGAQSAELHSRFRSAFPEAEFPHVTFVPPIGGDAPVHFALLFGWAFSTPRHLQKYSQLYSSHTVRTTSAASSSMAANGGISVLQFAGPAPVQGVRIPELDRLASRAADFLLSELRGEGGSKRCVFIHLFSNSGVLQFVHFLYLLREARYASVARALRGVVYDSCPAKVTGKSAALAFTSHLLPPPPLALTGARTPPPPVAPPTTSLAAASFAPPAPTHPTPPSSSSFPSAQGTPDETVAAAPRGGGLVSTVSRAFTFVWVSALRFVIATVFDVLMRKYKTEEAKESALGRHFGWDEMLSSPALHDVASLWVWSDGDAITDPDYVDAFVRRYRGAHRNAVCVTLRLPDSPHVAHLLKYEVEYSAAVKRFLIGCTDVTLSSETLYRDGQAVAQPRPLPRRDQTHNNDGTIGAGGHQVT